MKIFQVNTYLEHRGGTEESMLDLAAALVARGHQMGFIYHHQTGETLNLADCPSYHIPALWAQAWPNFVRLRQLTRIIRREVPDVLILQNVFNVWTIALLARLLPVVRFVRGHETYCIGLRKTLTGLDQECSIPHSYTCVRNCRRELWFPFRTMLYLYGKAEIGVNRRLQYLLVTSRYMRRNLLLNGFPEQKIEVLPPFVNLKPESPLPPSSNGIVLYVGRLEEIKGALLLPEIARLLPPGVRLMVAGDGVLRKELLETASRDELQKKLTFRGWLDGEELSQAYSEAEVVILPSICEEPFGRVGIEAMAVGRPVVAFDVGGVRDWLTHGETGFLVPRGDVEGMAERTNLLLRNRNLAGKMGRRGRERALSLFDRQRILSRLEQILNEAIEGWRGQRKREL